MVVNDRYIYYVFLYLLLYECIGGERVVIVFMVDTLHVVIDIIHVRQVLPSLNHSSSNLVFYNFCRLQKHSLTYCVYVHKNVHGNISCT